MTIRKTLQDMLRRDATAPTGNLLNFDEFDAVNWLLLLRAREMRKKAVLCDLLARDQTNQSGNVLLQSERDAILALIMGGNLDDALGTDTGCVAADPDGGGEPVVLLSRDDSVA